MIVFLDNRLVAAAEATLAIEDGALRFGDSLFETLLAKAGRIHFLEQHLDRIEHSAALLAFPCDRAAARAALELCAATLAAPVTRLRLTLTRGAYPGLQLPPATRPGRLLVSAAPYTPPTLAERAAGVDCVLAPNQRVNPLSHLPQMKRGNYADCLYAADHARRQGAREALFCDSAGNLLEGSSSNLFAILDGTLITPPAGELVLPGILRQQVLLAADHLGLPRRVTALPRNQLPEATEVFLSNSLIGLLPVARLGNITLQRGRTWQALLAAVDVSAEKCCNPRISS